MKPNADLAFIRSQGYQPADKLASIILVGGKGTRLANRRKSITPEAFPNLEPRYWNTIGPKGLATIQVQINGQQLSKPLTDWHLDIHCAAKEIQQLTLGLGYQGAVMQNYYERHYQSVYKGRKINYLVEKNPAGTLAPIVQLYCNQQLPTTPLVYANGDGLADLDLYQCYLAGLSRALRAKMDLEKLVIIVATVIPAEAASDYGVLELVPETGVVKGFHEKKAKLASTQTLNFNGRSMAAINAGFSIINHPSRLFSHYLSPEIVETSRLLDEGHLDYCKYELRVKYETLYGQIASDGHMVAVVSPNAWFDLGTEARIATAEAHFFKALQSLTPSDFLV